LAVAVVLTRGCVNSSNNPQTHTHTHTHTHNQTKTINQKRNNPKHPKGYGLTESCAASFVTVPWDARQAGTVGPPVPGIQVKLEAVPEMGYAPDGPGPARGEVCLRGPALFKGYYKQPELTAEAVDADGFFHTGDIGELTPHGFLRIVRLFLLLLFCLPRRPLFACGGCCDFGWVRGGSAAPVVASPGPNKPPTQQTHITPTHTTPTRSTARRTSSS
jgi:hypothetical protein